MLSHNGNSLVLPAQFIQAIRDAGYKSLGSALAELVDNAFEAKASEVSVTINFTNKNGNPDLNVVIADNGAGMDVRTLEHSLQFGWSSRFNRRDSVGRYGMGLPNASLSHARRVEVWTSTDGSARTVRILTLTRSWVVNQKRFSLPSALPTQNSAS